MRIHDRDGGYDDGYRGCCCFWGTAPGSLVTRLFPDTASVRGRVLDLGCGEGKNAAFLAERGATVDAVDCSGYALNNAAALWRHTDVRWHRRDALEYVRGPLERYDVIIMYGLLHCLASSAEALSLIDRCRELTSPGGLHIVCAFNRRSQDLSAHPTFKPLLLDHGTYIAAYDGWMVDATDEDLHETHPHNGIPHHHSLTRIAARAPS